MVHGEPFGILEAKHQPGLYRKGRLGAVLMDDEIGGAGGHVCLLCPQNQGMSSTRPIGFTSSA